MKERSKDKLEKIEELREELERAYKLLRLLNSRGMISIFKKKCVVFKYEWDEVTLFFGSIVGGKVRDAMIVSLRSSIAFIEEELERLLCDE